MTDVSPDESLNQYLRGLKKHVRAQVLLQKPTNTEDVLRLAEIHDPLVFGFSDKKHYKKPGTEFQRRKHTSGDAMQVTLSLKRVKEQLKRECRCYFCHKVGHITKTCSKKAALLVKQKNEKEGSSASNFYSHFSFWPTT